MTASFRRNLILYEDRRHAHGLVAPDRARDILGVAVAVVAIDQHREAARRDDVAHARADLAEAGEPDVGQRVAGADERKAADAVGRKARPLDQPRRQGVMREREEQGLLARKQLLPCCALNLWIGRH